MHRNTVIEQLYDIGAVKFGSFTLKSGIESPIYLDLRLIVSHPELLKSIAELIWKTIASIPCDLLCGVPYTALPIATAISLQHQVPMVMRRKEIKNYGTKKIIEGIFQKGQRCVVIEDLITSGSSVFETVEPLEQEGLTVEHIAVLIDREQGGKQAIESRGYHLHSAFTISDLLKALELAGKINQETADRVRDFIHSNQAAAL